LKNLHLCNATQLKSAAVRQIKGKTDKKHKHEKLELSEPQQLIKENTDIPRKCLVGKRVNSLLKWEE
jgi:hypothetical protein